MIDLYKEIVDLKDILIKYHTTDFSYGEYYTIGEITDSFDPLKIHMIQEGLICLENNATQPLIDILSSSTSIDDIYSEIDYRDFEVSIRNIFNPVIKLQVSKNFNINVSVVELIEESQSFEILQIRKKIGTMEKAYYSKECATVNTESKSILETLFKEICRRENVEVEKNIDIGPLTTKTLEVLNMKVVDYKDKVKTREFISKFHTLTKTIAEIRNTYSSAHGTDLVTLDDYINTEPHHYFLMMDITKTLCNFIIASYDFRKIKESNEQV